MLHSQINFLQNIFTIFREARIEITKEGLFIHKELTLLIKLFFLLSCKLQGNDLLFYIVFRPEPTFYPIERILGMIKNEFKIRPVRPKRRAKNMKTQFEMKNTLNGFIFSFSFNPSLLHNLINRVYFITQFFLHPR